MPNDRDDWRMRGRGRYEDDRRWERDDEPWRPGSRGDYGRFSPDEDRGGRGRSMWGGGRESGRRHRDELPSVGSPGIGGGTGGWWDQEEPWERAAERPGGMGDEDWSPGQTGAERMGRRWGGQVARDLGGSLGVEPVGAHRGKGPKNYRRSDERIREDVCDRLTDDDQVDASEIDVKVEDCEVTLTGSLPSRHMKRRAEDLAERVTGVRDVHNQLRVTRGSNGNGNGEGRERKGRG